MRTGIKKFTAVCGMAIMLALAAGITALPAYAASQGAYIAEACPSYKNPETNEVEDAGGEDSAVLGQAMTESAVYEKALVEVDEDGNTFITVRMQLTDNIENPVFEEDGEALGTEIMQEDFENNTADYRMSVNDYNSVFRCSMSVTAMGRDVVFYLSLKNLQPGIGDFVTSMESASEAPEEESRPEITAESSAPVSEGEKETESSGIQEFDAEGNQVQNAEEALPQHESHLGSFAMVFIIAAAAAAIIFCIWYFGFFRKKK